MQDQETPKIASGQKVASVPALPIGAGPLESFLSRPPGQHPLNSRDTQQAGPELEGHFSGGRCAAFSSDSSRPPARGQQQPAHQPAPARWFWVSKSQKRQEPRRLWVWHRSADREPFMCLVVEWMPSAACMASASTVLSSSRSSRSSWKERCCPRLLGRGSRGTSQQGLRGLRKPPQRGLHSDRAL